MNREEMLNVINVMARTRAVNKEVLSNAAAFVKAGHAQWKPEMDLETVEKLLRDWQAEKFVGTMFGNKAS